jgi:hypothetical protein
MSFAGFETSRKDGRPVFLYQFVGSNPSMGAIGPHAFTTAEDPIVRSGVTYLPWPVKHGEVIMSGTLDKKTLEIVLARGTALDGLFSAYPPSQVINAFIFKGHLGDTPSPTTYIAEWSGQVRGVNYDEGNELRLTVEPVSTSMQRPGLRRNYQLGCPHALYGEECQASKAARIQNRTVTIVSPAHININAAVTTVRGVGAYVGGTVQWTRTDGVVEIATIAAMHESGAYMRLKGTMRGLTAGMAVQIAPGCNRTMDHCLNIHNNIRNFGGQPSIPLQNPISSTSNFY